MSEPFVGEIRIFAGNFAPRGWAYCNGQLLAISQHDALFSLLGTIYGGDGRTTFAVPDMRGRLALHAGSGSGPGLTPRPLGQKTGEERHQLTVNELPNHNHSMTASSAAASTDNPAGAVLADTDTHASYSAGESPDADMAHRTGTSVGNQVHDNMMPFQCLNYIIALVGIYPSRN